MPTIDILPTGGALAAQITGLDLRQTLSLDTIASLRQALLDHCILIFRDQTLKPAEQIRFTNYFGRAVEHVREQPQRTHKEIFFIGNTQAGALGHDLIPFHSDLSYMPKPGTFSLLYAQEVPSQGGDTQWCNCYAAYNALNLEQKTQLHGLQAIHRHPVASQNPPQPVTHPVIRTHPETGRDALYVSPHLTHHLVGYTPTASTALLNILFAHQDQSRFIWTHQWHPNDLLIWDNRPTMHRRLPFPADERRLLRRTQIFGDEIPSSRHLP